MTTLSCACFCGALHVYINVSLLICVDLCTRAHIASVELLFAYSAMRGGAGVAAHQQVLPGQGLELVDLPVCAAEELESHIRLAVVPRHCTVRAV